MNKLSLLYSALRYPAALTGGHVGLAPIATVSLPTERPRHGHDHGLACA